MRFGDKYKDSTVFSALPNKVDCDDLPTSISILLRANLSGKM
jgi:hypothetical protein